MLENSNIKQQDDEKLALKLVTGDVPRVRMTGHSIDRIYDKRGHLVREIEGHNLVVDSFLNLVMSLLKRQDGYSGIQYWAVGSGEDTWDTNLPTPSKSAIKLTNEIGRMPITADNFSFLDTNYDKITTPSNILQISCTFGFNDCNGVWREFGLFGGNATTTLNSGILVNRRHHNVITKTNEMIVERIMRFILSLS